MSVRFEFDAEKTHEALLYLLSKAPRGLSKYHTIKLVFLSDKLHLVKYGRPITGDVYCALEYGPVPSKTLDLLNGALSGVAIRPQVRALLAAVQIDRNFRNARFLVAHSPEPENLSVSDRKVIDEVWERFGALDFEQLKALTHQMVAYQRGWSAKPAGKASGDMLFEDFFEDDEDAISGTLEEMIENSCLREAFSGA